MKILSNSLEFKGSTRITSIGDSDGLFIWISPDVTSLGILKQHLPMTLITTILKPHATFTDNKHNKTLPDISAYGIDLIHTP